ncbi:hypothetical protein BaRGS_00037207 [Batillaria attramentaria]|uniref:Uncharacterized protein n=1 Tax=Batillaria attramentaria TaxID=370345 RepID=A0ABD0J9T3_9CAEN
MFAADATDIKMSVQLSVFIKTPPTIGQTHPFTISRRDMMSWRFFSVFIESTVAGKEEGVPGRIMRL